MTASSPPTPAASPAYRPAPGSGLIHAKLQLWIYEPPYNVVSTKGQSKGKVLRRRGYRYAKELAHLFNGGIQVRDVEELKRVLGRVAEVLKGGDEDDGEKTAGGEGDGRTE